MTNRVLEKLSLAIVDIISVYIAIFLSLWMRFDGQVPTGHHTIALEHSVYIALIYVLFFCAFELYISLWEYAGLKELCMIVCACVSSALICTATALLLPQRLPLAVYVIAGLLMIFLSGGSRVLYRAIRKIWKNRCSKKPGDHAKVRNVLIIGAGDAGSMIIKEMRNNPYVMSMPVAVVDDDINKHNKKIQGVPIVGDTQSIPHTARCYHIAQIVFAIPSASVRQRKKILQLCTQTGCSVLVIQATSKFFSEGTESVLRPVCIEDLLGREQVDLNVPLIAGYLHGKTVMITGGGGSIGSELARQVMKFRIKKLIILDIYENNAYELVHGLRMQYGEEAHIDLLIASVRDKKRLKEIFAAYRPDVVFHAAAHKHVPLMEKNPAEAVKNNVMGTLNLAEISDAYGTGKFILISTDKAVNPTSVMGATKRVAEMIVQAYDRRSETEYMAVRFGNVLGSSGSVIPLFQKQIGNGGPVTVTHPDVERYFMTIPEAAQLVIQAGALADGGEIFVLDMGEPIKIIDLAQNMIRLSGFEPGAGIEIKVVGLRPGEKMFEELVHMGGHIKTDHEKIFVEVPQRISFDELYPKIIELIANIEDPDGIRRAITRIIPKYKADQKSIG